MYGCEMPARLAIAPVLVAWNPFAANSLTAAAMTCSRRSSDVDLTAMPDRLLIDLSIVKAGQRRERCRGWRAEGGARSGPRTVARAAGRGGWRAAGLTATAPAQRSPSPPPVAGRPPPRPAR